MTPVKTYLRLNIYRLICPQWLPDFTWAYFSLLDVLDRNFVPCPLNDFVNLTFKHYNTQKSSNGRNLGPVCRKFSRFFFVVGLFTLLSTFAVYC